MHHIILDRYSRNKFIIDLIKVFKFYLTLSSVFIGEIRISSRNQPQRGGASLLLPLIDYRGCPHKLALSGETLAIQAWNMERVPPHQIDAGVLLTYRRASLRSSQEQESRKQS